MAHRQAGALAKRHPIFGDASCIDVGAQCRGQGVMARASGAAKNRIKSKVQPKVELPIGAIKRVLGFAKARYRSKRTLIAYS
jgi:hypothetical protein